MATKYIAQAARRAAHALIATLGAASMQLQVALPPVANDDGEELGLRAPEFQAEVVSPVAIDRTAQHVEVLIPADTLEGVFGVEGTGAMQTALLTITMAQIEDEAYVVTGLEPLSVGGAECLYKVTLRPQGTEVV